MQGMLCGFCGIDPERFWWLDFRSIYNTIREFSRLEDARKKDVWESSRFIAMYLSKDAAKQKFTWEKSDLSGKPTVEQINEIKKRYESYQNSRINSR